MNTGPALPAAAAVRDRLAISTLAIHQQRVGAREIAALREAGFTHIEIDGFLPRQHYDHRDRGQIREIAAECARQGVQVVAVHGPNVPYADEYEGVRRAAVREAVASARAGERLGAAFFVGHFGLTERSERTACEMLAALEGSPIRLVAENGKDLRDFAAFVDRIGSDRLGMVVDIGHTRDPDGVNPFVKPGRAREALHACGRRLMHVHLHDFADADHYPPGDGCIAWGDVFLGLGDVGYKGHYLFEVVSRISPEDTLRKVGAFPDEFAARYPRGSEGAARSDAG